MPGQGLLSCTILSAWNAKLPLNPVTMSYHSATFKHIMGLNNFESVRSLFLPHLLKLKYIVCFVLTVTNVFII